MTRELETDVLIIGSGIAGLTAALSLADSGVSAHVLSCAGSLEESNSFHAQGGVIYEKGSEDKENLIGDILEAGCHANYRPAVEQLASLGPALVKKTLIERVKAEFDKESDGSFHLTREGAHSDPRIIHRGDSTGKSIEQALLRTCLEHPKLSFSSQTTGVNLLMTSYHAKERGERQAPARCFGAFVFDQKAREVYPIFAEHTILATGGLGQLFLHNTNSKFSRGDGIALAHRAGCRLENLEYIQFHPTTFFHPSSRRFLISEALRGEGAVLVNEQGERFLPRYLADYPNPELAPRDRVARAIHHEMLSTGASCVYLDISHKPSDWTRERFPFVYQSCKEYGVDITSAPIPVVPGAHYHCGGIWTDLTGKTSLSRLWAVGETACTGVHGANRLASTSLLEGVVWGTRAAESIALGLKQGERVGRPVIEPWKSERASVDPSFLKQDWLTLKHTMWNYVGLSKTEARLKRAEGILGELARGIEVFYRRAELSDALIGLRHATLVAILVLEAAKRNPRSLGCYLREEQEI